MSIVENSWWRKCLLSIFMSMWRRMLMRANLPKPTARSVFEAAGSSGPCCGAWRIYDVRPRSAVVTGSAGRRVEAIK